MIYQHGDDGSKHTEVGKTEILRPDLEKSDLFPQYRLEDEVLIDDILNTLREEENAAHE